MNAPRRYIARRRYNDSNQRLCDNPSCNRAGVRAAVHDRYGAWCRPCADDRAEFLADADDRENDPC